MYRLCMIVSSDLSPSSSLCLYVNEYLALLRRLIDFNGKTQIRPNMLQSLAPLLCSPSQRDAYNQALKRSLINYSMTRRNIRCVFFWWEVPIQCTFITPGWGTKNITFPHAWFAQYKNKSQGDLTMRVSNARYPDTESQCRNLFLHRGILDRNIAFTCFSCLEAEWIIEEIKPVKALWGLSPLLI